MAQTEHSPGPLLLDRLADAVDDLVLVLEEAQRPTSRGEVVDVVRHGVDEVRHLRDERRDDEEADRGEDEQREEEHEARRPQAAHAALLEPLDGGVERCGEQNRDEDPRQDVPGQVAEDEHEPHEHGDAEDEEDRPRANGDDAYLGGRHDGSVRDSEVCSSARGGTERRTRYSHRLHKGSGTLEATGQTEP